MMNEIVAVITFVAFIGVSVVTGLAITEEIQFENQIAAIGGLGFGAAVVLGVYSTVVGIILVDMCHGQPFVVGPWIFAFTILGIMTMAFGFGFGFYPNNEDLSAIVGIGFGMVVSFDMLITGLVVFCRLRTLQSSQPSQQQTPHIPPSFASSPITCEDIQNIEKQG